MITFVVHCGDFTLASFQTILVLYTHRTLYLPTIYLCACHDSTSLYTPKMITSIFENDNLISHIPEPIYYNKTKVSPNYCCRPDLRQFYQQTMEEDTQYCHHPPPKYHRSPLPTHTLGYLPECSHFPSKWETCTTLEWQY